MSLQQLNLAFKQDAAEAQRRMRAYWAGEMIDRPCISIQAPRDGAPVSRSLITAPDFDYSKAMTEFEEWAEGMFFGGESKRSGYSTPN